MPASRKRDTPRAKATARGGVRHHAHDGAPAERWALLGREFHARRLNLGYTTRESFAIAKGLITAKGAPNRRMIISVENNERQNYAPGRLEQFALAYEVTKESVYALLDGKTDELEPAPQPAPGRLPGGPPAPPPSNLIREAVGRPYFVPIYDRVIELADSGNSDPTGEELGLPPEYADVWDATRGRMSRGDRAWTVAEVQRREAARRESGNADSA